MAKLFSGKNNINPSQTNIPTPEQNQAEFLSIQKRSQEMIDLQTQDMLNKKQQEQNVDLDAATMDAGKAVIEEKYGGLDQVNQNTTEALNETKNTEPNSLNKLTDSSLPIITTIFFAFLAIVTIRFLFGKKR